MESTLLDIDIQDAPVKLSGKPRDWNRLLATCREAMAIAEGGQNLDVVITLTCLAPQEDER